MLMKEPAFLPDSLVLSRWPVRHGHTKLESANVTTAALQSD